MMNCYRKEVPQGIITSGAAARYLIYYNFCFNCLRNQLLHTLYSLNIHNRKPLKNVVLDDQWVSRCLTYDDMFESVSSISIWYHILKSFLTVK